MKIVSRILENVDGIATFYNVGLLIFVGLFIVIAYRTYKMPKEEIEEIKNSILE